MANVLPVAAVRSSDGTVIAATALGDVALGAVAVAPDGSRSLALAIPSDAVEVEIGSGARVVAVRPAPGGWRVELQSDTGARLEALVLRALKPSPPALGARCAIRLDAAHCRLVPG